MLIGAVAAVGVLHTIVPDHWAPITLLARQQGWSRVQTTRAAAGAGAGHTASTLVIAIIVWVAGAAFAAHFGHLVGLISSLALIGFGLWIAIASWRELQTADTVEHGHILMAHGHEHTHADGLKHRHWHNHHDEDWHVSNAVDGTLAAHEHEHKTSGRMALMLIVGSSPMVEGIPAFFAASRYGVGLLSIMAVVFALSTIATYVVICVAATSGAQRFNLGPLERYGEVLSGLFIALLGGVFLAFPQI